jgi:hypothetical protein
MPRPRFDSGTGRAAGQKSGEARRIRSVPIALPDFSDVAAVQAALEMMAKAGAGGTLHGAQLTAAVRAAECWLKCEDHRLDLQRVKQMEARIIELERELAAAHQRESQRREPWQDGTA